ncbi:hypothetical protein [Thermohalobacter berrensis]|uniref:Uncharacterized protein n=1 Tax=Thermohalobacter berrensis TaxID=99594 RepID=A0A419T3E0_9FIRM|nr:hypothetical protein [Thermohalobacter berrensis]RKD31965.1 hypothetical protein BET03_11855 [Thermohalobacter berrensis]
MNDKKRPAKKVALGGIITLLNSVCLYLVSIVPTNRIFLFWISTIFTAAMVVEFGVSSAILTFAATTILGFIIVPNKLILVPYVIFFGYYAIVKYYIERLNNLPLEWGIKILLFNIATYITYKIADILLFINIKSLLPIWAVILGLQVGFIIYDYFFSIMIKYYKEKLRKYII